MRKIKFRGKTPSGETICGACKPNLIRRSQSEVVAVGKYLHILNELGEWRMVLADTVAQFVGYDKNGKEIYSDDKILIYEYNCYGIGVCVGTDIAENFFTIADIGETFDNVEVYMDNENEN